MAADEGHALGRAEMFLLLSVVPVLPLFWLVRQGARGETDEDELIFGFEGGRMDEVEREDGLELEDDLEHEDDLDLAAWPFVGGHVESGTGQAWTWSF